MASELLRTKPLTLVIDEAAETGENTLKRALGPVNLVTLGIGAIIGAGIFVLTGAAAAKYAGPAIVLSFILAGSPAPLPVSVTPNSPRSSPSPALLTLTATPPSAKCSPGSSAGI